MNRNRAIPWAWAVVPLLLSVLACNLGSPQPEAVSPPPTLVQPTVAPPPLATATAPFEGLVPVGLPAQRLDQAGDVDSSPNAYLAKVTGGDIFVHGLYERPFNADPMDKYFPYLDIVNAQGFKDETWGFAAITLVNADSDGHLPGQYAVELDLDRDGRGDWLIRASNPASTEWTTQGVQAWSNTNGDIGGVSIMTADTHPRGGDGFENPIFDQGQGSLTDGAWVRVSPDDPKTVQLAFKLDMLGSPNSYALGAWAGTTVDPSLFDYHDHMTHIQAGSPNPGYEVYPLKQMAEIDNTCRLAVGFAPTGKEPGLCLTVQQQREAEAPCVPHQCPFSMNDPGCVTVVCP